MLNVKRCRDILNTYANSLDYTINWKSRESTGVYHDTKEILVQRNTYNKPISIVHALHELGHINQPKLQIPSFRALPKEQLIAKIVYFEAGAWSRGEQLMTELNLPHRQELIPLYHSDMCLALADYISKINILPFDLVIKISEQY